VFRVLIHPVRGHHYVEYIVEQVHLQDSVDFSGRGERRGRIHFDEPWLDVLVNEDVIAIALKAMLVIDDHALDALQRDVYDVVDVIETLVCDSLSSSLFKVESKILDAPFTAMTLVVVFRELLDSHISQMDVHVVQLSNVGSVLLIAETSKSHRIKPYFQRSVACNEHIDSEIELLLSYEQRVIHIP
jgi:hypothetical protein